MKALSLRQPFAEFVLNGSKPIETRKWRTSFRGEFLIHAAKAVDVERCKHDELDSKSFVTGAIVGKATLVSVKEYPNSRAWNADFKKHRSIVKQIDKPRYGFVLTNIVRFKKPIPYKGQLNFFTVPDSIIPEEYLSKSSKTI